MSSKELSFSEWGHLIDLIDTELMGCDTKESKFPLETLRFKLQQHQDGQLMPFKFNVNPAFVSLQGSH